MLHGKALARFKIAAVLSVVTLAAVGATLAVRFWVPENTFAPDTDILGNYLQIIGSIYAFVVGFVIYVVWTQYTKTEELIDREVGRLKAIGEAAEGPRPQIAAYAAAVVREIESAGNGRPLLGAAEREWAELTSAIRSSPAEQPRDLATYADLLRQLDQLTELRDARLSILASRIPWVLWDLILFVTFVTMAPFCFLRVQSLFVDVSMVASMASSLTFMLLLIRDLDDPFRGVFNVSLDPFRRLK